MALRPNDSIPQRRDTVADVKELVADVQLIPLLKKQVEIDQLTFKGLKANTMNYIGDLQIRGNLERLQVVSHGIDLNNTTAMLNNADVQGGISRHCTQRYYTERHYKKENSLEDKHQ